MPKPTPSIQSKGSAQLQQQEVYDGFEARITRMSGKFPGPGEGSKGDIVVAHVEGDTYMCIKNESGEWRRLPFGKPE
mgnify:CR=1 FL=1